MAALRSGRVAGAEMWLLHWFSCCSSEQPTSAQQRKQRQVRGRIDRSMIGEPTNFQHTGHIGSGEVGGARLQAVQQQMASKGGYQHCQSLAGSVPTPGHGLKVN
ncbi:hypothetical protein R5R35_009352 [Gryllus longicercus]|uniref:CRIB domain-containing protein n=2 Tax=Gryllus longicercus TaxID=2509291 RepID=A0AAN9VAW2_9ORTH